QRGSDECLAKVQRTSAREETLFLAAHRETICLDGRQNPGGRGGVYSEVFGGLGDTHRPLGGHQSQNLQGTVNCFNSRCRFAHTANLASLVAVVASLG